VSPGVRTYEGKDVDVFAIFLLYLFDEIQSWVDIYLVEAHDLFDKSRDGPGVHLRIGIHCGDGGDVIDWVLVWFELNLIGKCGGLPGYMV
jgi:hypothetical protein